MKYKKPFYYIIGAIELIIILMCATIIGCTMDAEPPEHTIYVSTEIIPDPNNYIKLQSETMIVFDNGFGHMDNWIIPEGMTFEIIVHEVDDWIRFYAMPDFITSSDRIYTVGTGSKHTTDFVVLHPPVMLYYFSIEVIINGDSTLIDYVIDSN